jgi:hypothetical protein
MNAGACAGALLLIGLVAAVMTESLGVSLIGVALMASAAYLLIRHPELWED